MANLAPSARSTTITLASASSGPFLVGFRLFEASGLSVYVDEAAPAGGFTVSANFDQGYDDTAAVTLSAPAPAGSVIRIDGDMTPARAADYLPGDPGLTRKLNIEFPRIWAILQELRRGVSFSLRTFSPTAPFQPKPGRALIGTIWGGVSGDGPNAADIAGAQERAEVVTDLYNRLTRSALSWGEGVIGTFDVNHPDLRTLKIYGTFTDPAQITVNLGNGAAQYPSDLALAPGADARGAFTLVRPADGSNWPAGMSYFIKGITQYEQREDGVTPQAFGAKGDGIADDADALERALRTGRPVTLEGTFLSSRQLTIEGPCIARAASRERGTIVFTTPGDEGIRVTPQSWADPVEFHDIAVLTRGSGIGTAIEVDQLGLPVGGIPYFDTRVRIEGCRIAGASMYTTGWKKGIRLTFPFAASVQRNEIYGKSFPHALLAVDFVNGSVGVEVADQTKRTLANFYLHGNVIMHFLDAAKIHNVEGLFADGNDFQVCHDGLSILNTLSRVNQYRLRFNHFGVSNKQLIARSFRQMILVGNEFSYRWGRDEGANLPLMHFINGRSISGSANNLRGNVDDAAIMRIDGMWLEADDPADPTLDVNITSGTFDRLNQIVRCFGPANAITNVNLFPNVIDDIWGNEMADWGNQNATVQGQLYLGAGPTGGLSRTANTPLTIASLGASAARLARSNNGVLMQFLHGSTSVGSINITATGSSMSTTSDARLKNDLGEMAEAGAIFDALRLHDFTWKAGGSRGSGVFAQELRSLLPGAVVTVGEGDEEVLQVNYDAFWPFALREIQSLRARVTALENLNTGGEA